MSKTLRCYVRISDGVFRKVSRRQLDAFHDGKGDLGVEVADGHVDVVELLVETEGRRVVGQPLNMWLQRDKVSKRGRLDPKYREQLLRHAVEKTFDAEQSEGNLIHARQRFFDRTSTWKMTEADRVALRALVK